MKCPTKAGVRKMCGKKILVECYVLELRSGGKDIYMVIYLESDEVPPLPPKIIDHEVEMGDGQS